MMSQPKEPYYFADDFPGLKAESKFDTFDKYESIFSSPRENQKVLCDASVFYLYSDVAIKNIYEYNNESRIIVMLRNPVDMIYSFHSQLVFEGYEDIENFQLAWEKQESRRNGVFLPKHCPDAKLLMYSDIGMYSIQIGRLFDTIERDRIHIIFFDEFVNQTRQEFDKVLEFLNLEQRPDFEFQRINENKRAKSVGLRRMLGKIPSPLLSLSKSFKRTLGIQGGLGEYLNALNVVKEVRMPLDPDFKQRLLDHFSEDIGKLEDLVGRKLDSWKSSNKQ